MTAYIEPSSPFDANDIDIASVRLNGVAPEPGTAKIEHHGEQLKIRFDRAAIHATLFPGKDVPMFVTGDFGSECFEAIDHIKVKGPKVTSPGPSANLASGSQFDVQWEDDDEVAVTHVSVLASYDNGENWELQASGIPNTGTYRWTVPQIASNQVRLAITTVYEVDELGYVTENEIAASEPFTITVAAGVGDPTASFALRRVAPNPGPGSFTVTFSLPNGAPAKLEVIDVSGRQVSTIDVGKMGAGQHAVTLGKQKSLPTGVYMVRLSQAGRNVSMRAVVIQ